jgi:hypothetical protein
MAENPTTVPALGWYRDEDGRQCYWAPDKPFLHGQRVGEIKPPFFDSLPRVAVHLTQKQQGILHRALRRALRIVSHG